MSLNNQEADFPHVSLDHQEMELLLTACYVFTNMTVVAFVMETQVKIRLRRTVHSPCSCSGSDMP
jgi:hypothetical protein